MAFGFGSFGLHFGEIPLSMIGASILPNAMSAAVRIGAISSSISAPSFGGIRESSGNGDASIMSPTAAIEMMFSSATGVGDGLTAVSSALTLSGDRTDPQPMDSNAQVNKIKANFLISNGGFSGEAGPHICLDADR